jgi:hypothetical protein
VNRRGFFSACVAAVAAPVNTNPVDAVQDALVAWDSADVVLVQPSAQVTLHGFDTGPHPSKLVCATCGTVFVSCSTEATQPRRWSFQ